jgi:hypothetical protein
MQHNVKHDPECTLTSRLALAPLPACIHFIPVYPANAAVFFSFCFMLFMFVDVACRSHRALFVRFSFAWHKFDDRPDGQSPDSTGQSKWPLRPGVLVHVGKLDSVNVSQLSNDSTPFRTTSVSSTFSKYKRNKSKVYARLQRLKDLLGFSGRDRVPSGITEGASGVVTYKKIKPTTPGSGNGTNSRKRKKPGYGSFLF